MAKHLKVLVICLIVIFCLSGVVSSDDITLPITRSHLDPTLPNLGTLPDPTNEDPIDPISVMNPNEDDSTTECKIFARGDSFSDSNNSMEGRYNGQVKVLSYSLGAGNAELGTAGNNVLKLTKHLDTSSKNLMIAATTGKHLRELNITVLKSRNPDEKLLFMKFLDLQVVSYNMITDNENPEDTVEEICVKFAKMEFEQTVYKEDGTPMPNPFTFRYDYKLNRTY